jgi:hypothetical protein
MTTMCPEKPVAVPLYHAAWHGFRDSNWVRAHARLKLPEDLRLPRLAHGLILITCRAKMEINREQTSWTVTNAFPG